jgi:hypothetical protein
MAQVEEQKIRERAHHLWEQAEQQHDPTHPRRIFHQVDRLESFVIMGNTMPPRDPEENEEDEEEEERADEPPVVREPDED